ELGLHPRPVEAFSQPAGRGGMRMDQPPGERCGDGRIADQQPVKKSRAAARHARDEDRPLDGPREQGGTLALATLELEEVVEAAADLELDRLTTQRIEITFRVARGDEALERLNERAVAEIGAARALERCREHILRPECGPATPSDDTRVRNPILSVHLYALPP